MAQKRIELPQGTLDLLILRTLALEPQHGWAISERIHQISSDVLLIQQGSLYPALHRLERRGWVKAKWGTSENNRRAKYYELTPMGRKHLAAETIEWRKLTNAMNPCMLPWAACFNTRWCGSRAVLKASLMLRIRCQRSAIWTACGAALRVASA